ncbi:MAG: DUF1329 domain-containing protein [Xanthomonadales bacterium]|nr:DUF1329 domain-containing protein [Gammaproteobacteria bacterium]NND57676.1 DUF1329 domain-containing protein [Xanthomonadales bacterium]NNK50981.1 DUF1329 domain-containing protein [Xanthomonadales bacterium]
MKHIYMKAAVCAALALSVTAAVAKVPESELARLDNDLTPMGSVRAGNEAGTIPAWTGGLTEPPANYTGTPHLADPFPSDPILFTITAANVDQYAANLSPGQVALFKKYPDTYKMNVYPSHRVVAMSDDVYAKIRENGAKAELINDGNGAVNFEVAHAFPIPQNAYEVLWNHLTRYRGGSAQRTYVQVPVQGNGAYVPVQITDTFTWPDFLEGGKDPVKDRNVLIYFTYAIHSPPQLTGTVLLVHETVDQVSDTRRAWLYNAGQRRVRRAPQVAYDGPGQGSDGTRTADDFDMFNGAPDRYNWKLVGKKEMYVPYNSYKMHSPDVTYKQLHNKGHMNQDYARYELHRVWEVEATLKEGSRHIYAKRVFYIDEDSWQIMVKDQYDGQGQLWRIGEAHAIQYYTINVPWITNETLMDLNDGRYLTLGLTNEEKEPYIFGLKMSRDDYDTSALRRLGKR